MPIMVDAIFFGSNPIFGDGKIFIAIIGAVSLNRPCRTSREGCMGKSEGQDEKKHIGWGSGVLSLTAFIRV